MASAFSNSPGGCCCEVVRIYDVYGTIRNTTGFDFYRTPSLYVHPASSSDSSKLQPLNWRIPSGNGLQVTATSNLVPVEQSGERVWSLENRQNTSYTALYDAVTKQELMAVPNSRLEGCSETHAGHMEAGRNVSGSPTWNTQWSQVSEAGVILTNTYSIFGDRPNILAKRYWPYFGGTRRIGNTGSFYLGRLDAAANAPIRQEVYVGGIGGGIEPGAGLIATEGWCAFDRTPGGWAGVVAWGPNTTLGIPEGHRVLLINGIEIEHTTDPNLNPVIDFRNCHVAYGSNNVLIGRTTDANPNRFELRCYSSGGDLLWTSPPCTSQPQCFASSDNWLYCRLPGAQVADMFNVEYPFVSSTRSYYLIKHDGSQVVPMGTFDPSIPRVNRWPLEQAQTELHPAWGSTPFFDVVHKSSLVGDSLPANAEDFLQLQK